MSHANVHRSAETHYVKGYPSLAAFIASDTDKSTHIYRRFDRLCARNLLYLQAELSELEARQDRLDSDEFNATTEQKRYVRNWSALRQKAAEVGNARERERVDVVMEIREKIQQYRPSIQAIICVVRDQADKLALIRRGCRAGELLAIYEPPNTTSARGLPKRFPQCQAPKGQFSDPWRSWQIHPR